MYTNIQVNVSQISHATPLVHQVDYCVLIAKLIVNFSRLHSAFQIYKTLPNLFI